MEYACNKSKKHMSIIVAISGACLGMLTFCMLYGTKILNVSYVEWLQGPDLPQHYIGWLFFRESAWHFPIGLIDNLIYPFQISIIYTDSIPIFALLFKLISPWIPETFQYFGMWGLLSFGVMGLITASLLFRLTYRAVYSLCISVFFILSTAVLARMFLHTALAGQWILMTGFFISTFRSNRYVFIAWLLLLSLATYIHIYFVPMTSLMMISYYMYHDWRRGKRAACMAYILFPMVVAIFHMWILGAFHGMDDPSSGGLGIYSSNLNTLVNPYQVSSASSESIWLHEMQPYFHIQNPGQWEGSSYMGLGIITFCFLSFFLLIKNRNDFWNHLKIHRRFWFILGIFFMLFSIIAISPVITLGNLIVVALPYPQPFLHVWSIFRASGRFIWPVMYACMIFATWVVARYYKNKVRLVCVAVICVVIQMVNLAPWLTRLHHHFAEGPINIQTSHLEQGLVLPDGCFSNIFLMNQMTTEDMYAIVRVAHIHSLRVNDFYLARKNEPNIQAYREQLMTEIETGNASSETVYIFTDLNGKSFEGKLHMYQLGHFIVGTKNILPDMPELRMERK